MLKRTGASVGWEVAVLLTFAFCLEAFAGTGGLLGEVDGTKPSHWGSCVRIPPDTGEFVVKDRAMTIHRKRPGGDFKIYRVFKGIEPQKDYVFTFQVCVEGRTAARVGVMHGADGLTWEWCAEPVAFEPSGQWQRATVRFRGAIRWG